MLKNKKLNSVNSLINDFMDNICFSGAGVISSETEFKKQTKLFLGEITNFHVESLLVVKDIVDESIDELEAFEKFLH